eukprot:scpid107968/ scgid3669/ Integral membrane protein GPR180
MYIVVFHLSFPLHLASYAHMSTCMHASFVRCVAVCSYALQGCYIWFFAYPLIILLGYFFSECRRHSLIVIGVGLAQTVALVLLCRLFLTRSLYWSVSSLGGPMLPLRAESSSLRSDTTFQQKSYGSSVYRANSYT